jgi:hypothetical protein
MRMQKGGNAAGHGKESLLATAQQRTDTATVVADDAAAASTASLEPFLCWNLQVEGLKYGGGWDSTCWAEKMA